MEGTRAAACRRWVQGGGEGVRRTGRAIMSTLPKSRDGIAPSPRCSRALQVSMAPPCGRRPLHLHWKWPMHTHSPVKRPSRSCSGAHLVATPLRLWGAATHTEWMHSRRPSGSWTLMDSWVSASAEEHVPHT